MYGAPVPGHMGGAYPAGGMMGTRCLFFSYS
jgi:hypothetical protein